MQSPGKTCAEKVWVRGICRGIDGCWSSVSTGRMLAMSLDHIFIGSRRFAVLRAGFPHLCTRGSWNCGLTERCCGGSPALGGARDRQTAQGDASGLPGAGGIWGSRALPFAGSLASALVTRLQTLGSSTAEPRKKQQEGKGVFALILIIGLSNIQAQATCLPCS